MADHVSEQARTEIMRAVKSTNTGPEMLVRKLVFSLGFRYRIHYKKLPGKPDLAFTKQRKVIFVHGCFWHGHKCKKNNLPKSNTPYWEEKIGSNQRRDKKTMGYLLEEGWDVLVIWECELANIELLRHKIMDFLNTKNLFLHKS